MEPIRIETTEKTVALFCPYHPDLSPAAMGLGGKYGGSNLWTFDSRDEERVKEMARKIYGTDGSPVDVATVRIDTSKLNRRELASQELWLLGRLIAKRGGRDYPVRLGEGVILIFGNFEKSGGSAKYPALGATDAVIEVRDVPLPLCLELARTRPDILMDEIPAPVNQLADIGTDLLIAELTRRGYSVK